ncbi:hypothetical protein RJ640_028578 [Escallonia rubra]|uniref:RING-type domain-containing protein n=1 Tax=Escallonia rubra TaxID=112253 RepID=A0AA88QPH5_9ASTE|nr:hypothetical protein RJ640_028578 [Escallonia rubra]
MWWTYSLIKPVLVCNPFPVRKRIGLVRCFQPKLSLFQKRLSPIPILIKSLHPYTYVRAEQSTAFHHNTLLFHRNSISPKNQTPFFNSHKLHLSQPNNMPTRSTLSTSSHRSSSLPSRSTLSTTTHRSSSLPENPFTGLIRYVSANCFFLKASGGECSICHEDFVPRDMVNRLPCSHSFHTRCILRWLKRSNTCPLCRSKVYKEEPARPKQTHGQPIRIIRLDRQSFHRVPTSQSRPAPTSRNVTRSVENEARIPQSRPTPTGRNVIRFHRVPTSQSRPAPTSRDVVRSVENEAHIPQSRPTPTGRNVIRSVENEDRGDAVSCVTLDEAGDTTFLNKICMIYYPYLHIKAMALDLQLPLVQKYWYRKFLSKLKLNLNKSDTTAAMLVLEIPAETNESSETPGEQLSFPKLDLVRKPFNLKLSAIHHEKIYETKSIHI